MTPKQSELLINLLNRAHKSKKPGAIFDLDSTLFQVNPRTLKILHNFASDKNFQKKYKEETKKLSGVKDLANTYYVKEQLIHLKMTDSPRPFYEDLYRYWKEHFFSDDLLIHDEPYEGASEFVHELLSHGVQIIYLTGRNIQNMLRGTRESLKEWDFPTEDDGATLVLKPQKEMDDAEFKRDYFLSLETNFDPLWFFENEPKNIELVEKTSPNVEIVFFDSVHSESKQRSPKHLPTIQSFKY